MACLGKTSNGRSKLQVTTIVPREDAQILFSLRMIEIEQKKREHKYGYAWKRIFGTNMDFST